MYVFYLLSSTNNFMKVSIYFRSIDLLKYKNVTIFAPQSLCPATTRQIVTPALYSPVFMTDIRWNYEKFLVGPDGQPLSRYSPDFEPSDPQLNADIRQQLDAIKSNNGGNLIGLFG